MKASVAVAAGISPNGGTTAPPISGQSGKTRAASSAVTLAPKTGGRRCDGAERREQREALARAATRQPGRMPGPNQQERQEADDGDRGGKVGGDRLAGVPEADRLPAQPGLKADEGERAKRAGEEAGAVAMVDDGEDGMPSTMTPITAAMRRWIHSAHALNSSGGMICP